MTVSLYEQKMFAKKGNSYYVSLRRLVGITMALYFRDRVRIAAGSQICPRDLDVAGPTEEGNE